MNFTVYNYLKKFFQRKFPEYYYIFRNDNGKFNEIANEIEKRGFNYRSVKSGELDGELSKVINSYLNENLTKRQRAEINDLYEYVYSVVSEFNTDMRYLRCSDDIMDHIVKRVVGELYPLYSEDLLDSEDFAKKVIKTYNGIYQEIYENLAEKIKLHVRNTLEAFKFNKEWGWVTEKELITNIPYQILESQDRDFLNLLEKARNSSMESLYEKYIDKYINHNKIYWERAERRIHTIVNKNYAHRTVMERNDVIMVIKKYLRWMKLLPSAREISNGNMDSEIRKCATNYFRDLDNSITRVFYPDNNTDRFHNSMISSDSLRDARNNSVKRDGVPDRFKPEVKKRKLPQNLAVLIIVATLLGYSINGVVTMANDIHGHFAKENISMIDNYYYSNIYTVHTDAFELTSDNIINTFDEYSQFNNENYKYLAFYQAYKSVKDDRLYIMDNMLKEVKNTTRNNKKYSELYDCIDTNGWYLDFMYDRLYSMGYTEIRDQKYVDLLHDYARIRNEHPYDDAVQYLSPRQQRLLEKVRDLYIEYSERYLVELGDLLGNGEYAVTMYDDNRRNSL